MNTTSSVAKNSYGKSQRRYKPRSKMDRKIASVAKKVVAQELADEIELKTYDRVEVLFAPVAVDGTNLYSLSNTIPQGVANQQRIGDQIKIKSLFVRLSLQANDDATYNNVRIIVFRWNSEASPFGADILKLTSSTFIRQLSQLNTENRRNFQIKYDNTFTVGGPFNVSTAVQNGLPQSQEDKFYIKTFGDAYWEPAGSTTPAKGHIYLLAISDSPSNPPQLSFTARVRYTDS